MTKKFYVFLLFVFLILSTQAAFAQTQGDVNSNGTIDIIDSLMIAQSYAGLNPTGFTAANADVNCDNLINLTDGLLVAQYYVGLVASLACQGTATATASPTATPTTTGASSLKVQYKCMDTNATAGSIRASFNIINLSAAAVPLSELSVRYYYTLENAGEQTFNCDYAAMGSANLIPKWVGFPESNYYIEISFASGSPLIAAGGSSGEFQTRWQVYNFAVQTQTNDYSFGPAITAFTDYTKVTLYRNGVLVWGTEAYYNTTPVVTLTSPVNNAAYAANASVTVSATATDNKTIALVEFFSGSTKIGEDATSPYSITWASVPAGIYSIRAKATDNEGLAGYSSSAKITVGAVEGGIYEAEAGTLTGTTISNVTPGYSGTGYVTGFDTTGDSVAVSVTVTTAGLYNVTIQYAGIYGEKTNDLYINNEAQGGIVFPATTSFVELAAGKVYLNSGVNSVKIVHSWGWFEVDYFKVVTATDIPVLSVPKTLVNANASAQARSLMSFLVDNYGKKIISGQQELGDSTEFTYLQTTTGKLPALRGFDMQNYSTVSTYDDKTIERIIDWYNTKNGIPAVCWHWMSPSGATGDMYKSFYTEYTTFDVSRAVVSGNVEYTQVIADIDAIAAQFKRLQAVNVPILFRPLHEAQGAWFWWGAKGADACVKLYKMMYDRLVTYHGLNNIIWVWTSYDSPTSLTWYPGDNYVDIVGFDIYNADGNYGANTPKFYNLVSMYAGKKLVTLSENGPIPDPDKLVLEKAGWSWFMVWWGSYINNGITNTVTHLIKVYNHAYVLTLDELPALKTYVY